jgi:hypothetical protein
LLEREDDEKKQLKMFQDYKKYFTLIEGISFLFFIIFGIITLIDFIFYDKYEIFEFFQTAPFIITVISGTILLSTPSVFKFYILKGQKLLKEIRIRNFKDNFSKNFKNAKEIDLDEISKKYKIDMEELKKIFEDLLKEGVIKGEMYGNSFVLALNFVISSPDQLNIQKFKQNIEEYVKPYRWLNIPKTAKYFKLPVEVVREEILNLIHDKKILGFLDGDNLVRELSIISTDLSDLPECPFCDNKVLGHSKYCSTCGKQIDFDKIMDEDKSES